MKKKQLAFIFASLSIFSIGLFGQGGSPGNFRVPGQFLGWNNAGTSGPLDVRNDFNDKIRFFTFGGRERFRIFENNVSPSCPTGGGVAINARPLQPVAVPGSYLHIGSTVPTLNNTTGPGVFGWRNWMQLGTFIYDASDNMYVGLKQEGQGGPGGGDRYDAIINWGDNINSANLNPTPGPDYLRFIFTGSYNPSGNNSTPGTTAPNADGLEVMRFAPVGNMGIGNFYNNPLFPYRDPARRLEILSDKTAIGINGNPQMRITHTQQNPFILNTTGLFSEFQTTNTGDLAITTFNNTNAITGTQNLKQRFVGINTNTPGNSLEVNSQYLTPATANGQPVAPTFGAPTGWAGLRLTDLTSGSVPQLNPGQGVLSVNAAGDVVYVPGGGIPIGNNGIFVNNGVIQLGSDCANSNPATKSAQGLQNTRFLHLNGNNFIFGDGGRVGIGMAPFPPQGACVVGNKLEVISTAGVPYFGSANGSSGLRLTNLTSAAVPLPNGTNGVNVANVLSVDANGDVVLVNPIATANANNGLQVTAGNVQLGGDCNVPAQVTAAQLLTNRKVDLNKNSIIFSDLAGVNGRIGIGNFPAICFPGNLLEVNKGVPSSTSGLRLTDLVGVAPLAANGQVLSVNPTTGDVILTTAPAGGGGFGNLCVAAQNPLTGDFEMPLATNKYLFTGQSVINNAVQQDVMAVGYNCGSVLPPSKFSSLQQQLGQTTTQTFAGHFKNADVSNVPLPLFPISPVTGGIYAESKATAVNFGAVNVGGIGEATGALQSIGLLGRIDPKIPTTMGGRYAMGGAFISDATVTNPLTANVTNFGVYATAANSSVNNYGVYSEVPLSNSPGSVTNYAFYGTAPSIGPNSSNPSGTGFEYAGYFDGDVTVLGVFNNPSDQNLKQNIDTIPNALNILKQLKPKQFDYKLTQYPHMNLSSGLQYGLIAQDVQTVVPAIVTNNNHPAKYDNMGNIVNSAVNYKGLEYQQLIPILIRAVQQLSDQNHKQDSIIQVLTQNIASCCSNSAVRTTGIIGNQTDVELSDKNAIVLNQNVPNPFAESTVITYNIPIDFKVAQIIFNALDGRIIKAVDVNQKGKGQINVYANDLTNGLYSYYLIVDGKVIDTKKLIKQN